MKLIYRGLSYDRQSVSTQASDAISNTQAAAELTPHTLLYRGVEYQTDPARPSTAPAAGS